MPLQPHRPPCSASFHPKLICWQKQKSNKNKLCNPSITKIRVQTKKISVINAIKKNQRSKINVINLSIRYREINVAISSRQRSSAWQNIKEACHPELVEGSWGEAGPPCFDGAQHDNPIKFAIQPPEFQNLKSHISHLTSNFYLCPCKKKSSFLTLARNSPNL